MLIEKCLDDSPMNHLICTIVPILCKLWITGNIGRLSQSVKAGTSRHKLAGVCGRISLDKATVLAPVCCMTLDAGHLHEWVQYARDVYVIKPARSHIYIHTCIHMRVYAL